MYLSNNFEDAEFWILDFWQRVGWLSRCLFCFENLTWVWFRSVAWELGKKCLCC